MSFAALKLDQAAPIAGKELPSPQFQRFWQNFGQALEEAFAALDETDADLADTIADLLVVQADLEDAIDFLNELAANQAIAQFAASGVGNVASYSPNGSGDVTIEHGYSSSWIAAGFDISPSRCLALPHGTTAFHVQIISLDATNLVVRLFDMAGVPIISGSYTLHWRVWGGTTA